MKIFIGIIGGLIGYAFCEKYQRFFGSWMNAWIAWAILCIGLFVLYNIVFLTPS